jgi:hypothetical protein
MFFFKEKLSNISSFPLNLNHKVVAFFFIHWADQRVFF